uniref:Uncharacterized protein n=1 Tax=Cucumis melo TaxID=3656 RepID=A0A9I9EB66_CUCME
MVSKKQQASCNKSIKSKQQHNHINLQHLDILDYDETFKDYPWGRLSYILTYQFLKKVS